MMALKHYSTLLFCLLLTLGQAQKKRNKAIEKSPTSTNEKAYTGFFDFSYNAVNGSIVLKIEKSTQLDQPFLYVNGLSAGIGSNDIGLDRGHRKRARVISKMGDKIMMVQPNLDYRSNW